MDRNGQLLLRTGMASTFSEPHRTGQQVSRSYGL
eukprot:CAMPEP_0170127470 /NCGR_PEP_ID=MMETSP0020_2-20130122/20455_1 /TAXON_ID=98059 /ORGANISM="Dinobryon sp., Strain UTEXLB2267" /LENGTH=33 /DNA_ID= /DNA_START= /DNA_END= /DNA_ORIENTATION=